MNVEAGIELCGLTVRYGRTLALDAVDLEAQHRAVYVLLGRNGAGKSTVVRVIAGLVLPSGGDLRIAGTSVRSSDIHRVRRSLGFLPQEPVLHEELSGTEFLRFIRDLYGVAPTEEDRQRGQLARMDVGAWVDDAPIRAYSTGMRKKIALLASLVPRPKCWVLDEPFAGLDEAGARAVEDEIERIRADGLVFLTSHDPHLAERLADRVGVLDGGRTVFEGPVASFRAVRRELFSATALAGGSAG
jgi:ABC-2 type transport system ATP-binding protein